MAFEIKKLTKEYPKQNENIRNLYIKTSKSDGISLKFISRVIDTDLLDPIDTYTNNGNIMYIAVLDDVLVGMVGLIKHDDYFELQRLVVHKDYRRQGIARALLSNAMKDRKIRLSCLSTNKSAITLYTTTEGLYEERREGGAYVLIYYSNTKLN